MGEKGAAEEGGPATRMAADADAEGWDEVGEVSFEKSNIMCVGDIGVYGRNKFDYNS
jgi:hypothetical protein